MATNSARSDLLRSRSTLLPSLAIGSALLAILFCFIPRGYILAVIGAVAANALTIMGYKYKKALKKGSAGRKLWVLGLALSLLSLLLALFVMFLLTWGIYVSSVALGFFQ